MLSNPALIVLKICVVIYFRINFVVNRAFVNDTNTFLCCHHRKNDCTCRSTVDMPQLIGHFVNIQFILTEYTMILKAHPITIPLPECFSFRKDQFILLLFFRNI